MRRNLWLPLLLILGSVLACGLGLFRRIGIGELAFILVPLMLVIIIEGSRYVVRQFRKGYRG